MKQYVEAAVDGVLGAFFVMGFVIYGWVDYLRKKRRG